MLRSSDGIEDGAPVTSRFKSSLPDKGNGVVIVLWQLVLCVFLAAGSVPAADPEIESVHWGYDGRVVVPAFNPLTLVVHNPAGSDLSGSLELQRLRGGYWTVGLPIRQPVFVSPGQRRPVRFYPYAIGQLDDWRLTWIDSEGNRRVLETAELKPRVGAPTTVLLETPGRLTNRGGRLPTLDETWFPPVSTATDGLAGVVLDHVPRWDLPRRRSFLQWLERGGTVHLLETRSGEDVVFGGDLKILNGNNAVVRHGTGRVIRQPFGVADIPDGFSIGKKPGKQAGIDTLSMGNEFEPVAAIDDAALFSALRSMTRPHRNWPLIYVMCLVYMGLLFPGGFLFGQGGRDFRAVLALLGGTVVFFSVVFFLVGRRDDISTFVIRTATVAHHRTDGDLDYRQWVEAAANRGGNYRFTHHGRGRLYSTAQNFEKVAGTIEHGPTAALTVDLPPYSSSTFLVRGRLPRSSVEMRLVDFQATGNQLQAMSVSLGNGFSGRIRRAAVLAGDRFYSLVQRDGLLQLNRQGGRLIANGHGGTGRLSPVFDPEFDPFRDVEEVYDSMFETLTLRSLGLTTRQDVSHFRLPPDRLRVFVYAPAFDSLLVQADESHDQVGFVLHTWDIQAETVP